MKLDPEASLITVELTIFKGTKSRLVRMALDMGASRVMVPWNVLEVLGHAPTKARKKACITIASGTAIAPLVTLDKERSWQDGREDPGNVRPPATRSGRWTAGSFVSEMVRH